MITLPNIVKIIVIASVLQRNTYRGEVLYSTSIAGDLVGVRNCPHYAGMSLCTVHYRAGPANIILAEIAVITVMEDILY